MLQKLFYSHTKEADLNRCSLRIIRSATKKEGMNAIIFISQGFIFISFSLLFTALTISLRLYIEHDSKYFRVILDFLRDGKVRVDSNDAKKVREEFEFYNLPIPTEISESFVSYN